MGKLNILKRLISYQTDGDVNNINECMEYIANFLKEKGWQVEFVTNSTDGKKNLIACLNSELRNISDGLILSGHIDTVTANKAEWQTNPFVLTRQENYLIGLGVADIKEKYKLNECLYNASTESGYFQNLGVDCVIFGAGDIGVAHSVNESIEESQMQQYSDIVLSIIRDVCC